MIKVLVLWAVATRALVPPAARSARGGAVRSTKEPPKKSLRGQDLQTQEASADWLARQGLVAPGASPEQHEAAKAYRLQKKKNTKKPGGALVVATKKARWGDAARVRDVPIDGGWSDNVARGTYRIRG